MGWTKQDVKARMGIRSDAELARFFRIRRCAVGQWPSDELIPRARQWELHARLPHVFIDAPPIKTVAPEPDTHDAEPAPE